jgi:hypothetical protein
MNKEPKMNRFLAGMAALAVAAQVTGCVATTTPNTDARMGLATDMMKAQQTLYPDASRNTDPVLGMSGRTAKGALDNYHDSFRKPPAESTSLFSIGGNAGGSR